MQRTCTPSVLILVNLRKHRWKVLLAIVALAASYVVLGLPWYIEYDAVDINSGRERTVGTLFGFTVSCRDRDTESSKFIAEHLGQRPAPQWYVYHQWRPFDSTRRCYFFSSNARIAYKDLLLWFEEMQVPRSDQIRIMEAAIRTAQAGDWVSTFVEDDSLGVGSTGDEAPAAKWTRGTASR